MTSGRMLWALWVLWVLVAPSASAQTANEPSPNPGPTSPVTARPGQQGPSLVPGLNPPRLEDASDALTNILFQLTSPALFDTDRDVDRKIGSPWGLQESTNARLDSLPPRLRLLLYGTLAERLGDLVYVRNEYNSTPYVPYGGDRVRVTFVGGTGEYLMSNVLNTVRGHFNPDEIADLGVYTLSQFPPFPRSEKGWERWKHAIVRYDVWLAVAMLMALIGTDSAAFQASKWLFTLGRDWRLGAFGYVSNLGVNFRPTIRFTARAISPFFEMSADFVEYIKSRGKQPQRVLELFGREHWLNFLSRRFGWELVASGNARYNWIHGDPKEHHRLYGSTDLYWRRSGLLGQPNISVQGSMNVNTDFSRGLGTGTSISVEDTLREFAAAVRINTAADLTRHTQEWRIGVVLGGAIVSRVAIARAALATSANRVRSDIEALQRVDAELRLLEARFDDDGLHDEFHDQAALLPRMRVLSVARAQARVELTRSITDYEDARYRCYRLEGMNGKVDDSVGPLPAYELLRARTVLDDSF